MAARFVYPMKGKYIIMNSVKYAVINKNIAALRNKPCETSERIDEGLFGMDTQVIADKGNGWYYIKTFYDYEGYINEKEIILMDEKQCKEWKKKAVSHIRHTTADVLSEPKYNSNIIITLTRGAFISDTGEKEGYWSKIELPDQSFGWVRTEYVKNIEKLAIENETAIRENLVNTAVQYMDTQYRWGGKSSLGIDCSGLCSMAYMLNGFIIYRDAVLKEKYMKNIAFEDIKKGDLIFFPGHVAMYIENGKYIHSNGKYGGVCINSFNKNDEDFREDLANSIEGVGSIF